MDSASGTCGTVGLQSHHHANEEVVLQKNEMRFVLGGSACVCLVRCEGAHIFMC